MGRRMLSGAAGALVVCCGVVPAARAVNVPLVNPGFAASITGPAGGIDFESVHYNVGDPIPDHTYVPGVGVNGALSDSHSGAQIGANALCDGYVGSPENNAGVLRDTRDFTNGPTGPGGFITVPASGPAAIYQVNSAGAYQPNTTYTLTVDVFDRNAAIGAGGADVVSFPTNVDVSLMTDLTEVMGEVLAFSPPANGDKSVFTLTYTTGAVPPSGNIGFVLRASGIPAVPLAVTQVVFDNVALNASPVPEPAGLALAVLAAAGLATRSRRRMS